MEVLAGVDDTDGVDGGVLMPPSPRDPFGEQLLAIGTGDGMLYLKWENINDINKAQWTLDL